MSKRLFKIAVIAAVIVAALWALSALTGDSVTVKVRNGSKRHKQLRRRRRVDGAAWQPQGVLGPANQPMTTFAPPLAPISQV
jgi:hypothetical protein